MFFIHANSIWASWDVPTRHQWPTCVRQRWHSSTNMLPCSSARRLYGKPERTWRPSMFWLTNNCKCPAMTAACYQIHRKKINSQTFSQSLDFHHFYTYTNTRLMALCTGIPGWAGTRKVRPILILLKQETASGSGIHWAICKSAPRSRQITMPAPHRSVFHRLDALPATQPTVSGHWRQFVTNTV